MQDQENKFTNDLTSTDLNEKYQNFGEKVEGDIDYRFVKEKPKGISQLAKEIHQTNVEKGFWDISTSVLRKAKAGEKLNEEEITYIANAFSSMRLMLIVSEAAEGMEALRKGKKNTDTPLLDIMQEKGQTATTHPEDYKAYFSVEVKDTYADELADSMIRLMDLAEGENIDIEKHINMKLAYNQSREKMHGGKKF